MTKTIVTLQAFLLVAHCFLITSATANVPTELRCEYLVNPLGIDVVRPRFSWKLRASEPDLQEVGQSTYQVLVASSREILDRGEGDRWNSKTVKSTKSVHVEYDGQTLAYGNACYWKVRVTDRNGVQSNWSPPASFTVGPIDLSDWSAKWIGAESGNTNGSYLAFENTFQLSTQPQRALAYITSLGYHELFINGKKVSDCVLAPSISDYSKRARYVTYDLTSHLQTGANRITIRAAPGWASFPRFGQTRHPLIRCQVDIQHTDGTTVRIETDESWQTLYTGSKQLDRWVKEHYAAERQEEKMEPTATKVFEIPLNISAEKVEPNRLFELLEPVEISKRDTGWRIDFRRQFTGWLEVPLEAPAGTVVDLRISERKDEDVSYNQKIQVVVPASGSTRFRHRFNYVSGRWLTIDGPVKRPENVRAYLVHTDYPQLTEFRCSNDLLNRIHDTTMWTFRCLSVGGYVVDCSHRERLGYGGDAHATIPTGLSHFGLGAFYTKWLEDWRDVQTADGNIPDTAPTHEAGGGPAWSGVVIQLPWRLYIHYGDLQVLEKNWPMMVRWLSFIDTKTRDGLLQHYGDEKWGFLGDWVPPGRKQSPAARVDDRSTLFFNNCYWLWSVQTAAKIAEVLGKSDEVERLQQQADKIRKRVHQEFWDPERGVYANGEQPYLAFPLLIGLPPEELRPQIEKQLEHAILVQDKGHINAGIHGHVLLLDYLTRAGRSDLAFEMINKTTYPSWGHMFENGATTIWEQWDGEESRCHSSFLGVGAWFIRGLAGIVPDPLQPGYEHFFVKPQVCGDVTSCDASYESIRGRIESHWQLEAGILKLTVLVPPNTTATVQLPDGDTWIDHHVGSGRHQFTTALPTTNQ